MKLGTVCTGIGGIDLGFHRAGFTPAFMCEIDEDCRNVLRRHFPGVPLFKDMREIGKHNLPPVDVLAGGTPCQGFSLAGLRGSLSDDRSNLCLQFCRIADELEPAIIVWENVPGVLSTPDNAFGCFLAALVGADAPLVPPRSIDRWRVDNEGRDVFGWTDAGVVAGPRRTAAWRVLDSQWFGVAQRRERVFVVASPRAELPFQILFEPEGVRRHSPPRREAGQRTAPTLEGRAGRSGCNSFATSGGLAEIAPTISARNKGGGGLGTDAECDGALIASHDVAQPLLAKANSSHRADAESYVAHALNAKGGIDRCDYESETFVTHALRADGFDASEDGTGRGTPLVPVISPPLTAGGNSTGGNRFPGTCVDNCESLIPVAFQSKASSTQSMNPAEIAPALDVGKSDGVAIAFKPGQGGKARSLSVTEDLSPTLESADAGNNKPAIAFTERTRADGRNFECQEEIAYALTNPGSGGRTHSRQIAQGYAVRRLTPRECERLQGFPDDWTLVENTRGKPMADGPRYKQMGNAVTVNAVEWLARRILSEFQS
jgi:DNA (cytosine-5)-methyltransferase 1